jgi:DNA-binding IclR family transcriptional regulator
MASVLPEKQIKSANRVLEILELFDASRQTVTVMDVARALGVPQSSTSELLGCLVKQGYLQRDRYARTYAPTARVALLGAWVQPNLFRNGRLLPMMDEIVENSGHPVFLASMVGVVLRHVHVVGCEVAHAMRSGSDHSLLHSPLGKVLLSTFDREVVRKLVHRLNAEAEPEQFVRINDFLADLDQIRAKGYATGLAEDQCSAIVSVLLPQSGEEQMSLGIAVPLEAMEENLARYVKLLRGAVSSHLGPTLASSTYTERPRYARVM